MYPVPTNIVCPYGLKNFYKVGSKDASYKPPSYIVNIFFCLCAGSQNMVASRNE